MSGTWRSSKSPAKLWGQRTSWQPCSVMTTQMPALSCEHIKVTAVLSFLPLFYVYKVASVLCCGTAACCILLSFVFECRVCSFLSSICLSYRCLLNKQQRRKRLVQGCLWDTSTPKFIKEVSLLPIHWSSSYTTPWHNWTKTTIFVSNYLLSTWPGI